MKNYDEKLPSKFDKNAQYYKFCAYGFLKNLKFYEPFLILFFLEKGITFLQIGVLYAIREILINIFEIPSGLAADTFGRRRSMAFSLIAYIFSFTTFFFSHNFWILILAMFFYAVGDAFRTGTHKAMIFVYLKENNISHLRAAYYGATRSCSQIGSALSALIAAFLVFTSGSYRYIFLFTIIPYVIDLFLILSYPKSLDHVDKEDDQTVLSLFKTQIVSLVKSFRNMTLVKAIGNQALYSGYYKAVKDYIQPMITSLAVATTLFSIESEKQKVALVTAVVYGILYILTSIVSRRSAAVSSVFSSKQKALNVYLFTGALLGISSTLLYYRNIPLVSILLFFGIYIIENLRKPVGIDYLTSLMKSEVLASSLSVESQSETLFAVLFSLLIGLFSSLFSIEIALICVSILMFFLSFVFRVKAEK
ncbi:MAG: MFS transporter [Sphaerochaetaceae bacterium]